MVAPYKRGEYFCNGYLSKASNVEEDQSKSSNDETRLSRETDIDDIGSVVESKPRNAKEPDIASAESCECTKTKSKFPKGYQLRERHESAKPRARQKRIAGLNDNLP